MRNTADPLYVTRTDNGVILDFNADFFSEYRGDIDQLFALIEPYKGQGEAGFTQEGGKGYAQRIALTDEQLQVFMQQAQQAGAPIELAEAPAPLAPIVEPMDIRAAQERGDTISKVIGGGLVAGGGAVAASNPETRAAVADKGRQAASAVRQRGAQAAGKATNLGKAAKVLGQAALRRL